MRGVNEKIAAFEFATQATKRFTVSRSVLLCLRFGSVESFRCSFFVCVYVCISCLGGRPTTRVQYYWRQQKETRDRVSFQKCFSIEIAIGTEISL